MRIELRGGSTLLRFIAATRTSLRGLDPVRIKEEVRRLYQIETLPLEIRFCSLRRILTWKRASGLYR